MCRLAIHVVCLYVSMLPPLPCTYSHLLLYTTSQEFLVLVMDLVPAGDLSEFVLTKKRLNADQVGAHVARCVECWCAVPGIWMCG